MISWQPNFATHFNSNSSHFNQCSFDIITHIIRYTSFSHGKSFLLLSHLPIYTASAVIYHLLKFSVVTLTISVIFVCRLCKGFSVRLTELHAKFLSRVPTKTDEVSNLPMFFITKVYDTFEREDYNHNVCHNDLSEAH